MSAIASQITSPTIVYSTVYSAADQRKHQSSASLQRKHQNSASLAFVRGFHRGPVNSPHKGPVTRKMYHLMTSSCHWGLLVHTSSLNSVISEQRHHCIIWWFGNGEVMACRRLMPNHYPNHQLLILNCTRNTDIYAFATIVGLSVLRYIQMADIIRQVIMRWDKLRYANCFTCALAHYAYNICISCRATLAHNYRPTGFVCDPCNGCKARNFTMKW